MGSINWLAVIVAAVATFALGALWYGPVVGKLWMRASGMTEEKAAGSMGTTFALAFVLQLVAAIALAMFIGPDATVGAGLFAGFMTGAFFVSTALGVVYLFERRPALLWAIDGGYQVLAFSLMGMILGAW
ncbi:MAG: DUF1761 family protein [Gemmatimonadetes bacterium]|nr:DUF1761 domain-containing protein [Gemmatimonadota bacterium]NIQ59486.1 DUF1761 domain-containing protein [Gemmatimonadota bacterium]NIU79681.1 DUF1761 family protein [Gammaproteobacteria bacterium]NIX48237.1 DUF1761 family protein [Gemmatimonadota bacterium]NIY12673.1 DUF1761 family protein [Gemmatimonadota bacterium]